MPKPTPESPEPAKKPPTSVAETKKTERKRPRKITRDQQNEDGTFRPGNAGGGRPKQALSFRHRMRVIAEADPSVVDEIIASMLSIARDLNNPRCIEAADKLIKLFGNYDPTETKDVTPQVRSRPLEGISLAEVREALAATSKPPRLTRKSKAKGKK